MFTLTGAAFLCHAHAAVTVVLLTALTLSWSTSIRAEKTHVHVSDLVILTLQRAAFHPRPRRPIVYLPAAGWQPVTEEPHTAACRRGTR